MNLKLEVGNELISVFYFLKYLNILLGTNIISAYKKIVEDYKIKILYTVILDTIVVIDLILLKYLFII